MVPKLNLDKVVTAVPKFVPTSLIEKIKLTSNVYLSDNRKTKLKKSLLDLIKEKQIEHSLQ